MNPTPIVLAAGVVVGLALASAAPGQGTADTPAAKPKAAATVEELVRDLGETRAKDKVKRALQEQVLGGRYQLQRLLEEQVERAVKMEAFLAAEAVRHQVVRANLPEAVAAIPRDEWVNIKTAQRTHLTEVSTALSLLDAAAEEASKDKQDLRWLLIARAHLRVRRCVPTVEQLIPLQKEEAEQRNELGLLASQGADKLREGWLILRKRRLAQLGDVGTLLGKEREVTGQYFARLDELLAAADADWKRAVAGSRFLRDWRGWVAAQASLTPEVRPARIVASRAAAGQRASLSRLAVVALARPWLADGGTGATLAGLGTYSHEMSGEVPLRDRNLLVPWPFVLAEAVGMGRLQASYDAMGFDVGEGSSATDPFIHPRIRVRMEFQPADGRSPPLVAIDHRLRDPSVRLAEVPLPRYLNRPPAEDTAANRMAFWAEQLPLGLQANPAAEALLGGHWRRRLDDAWYEAIVPPLDVAPQGTPPESLRVVLGSLRRVAQDELRRLAEASLGRLTSREQAQFEAARDLAEQCRRAVKELGGDPRHVLLPEVILRDHAQRNFDTWDQYFGRMLPDPLPTRAVVVHPWPASTPPGVASGVADVQQMRRRMERGYVEALAKAADGDDTPEPLLREVAAALEPADGLFRLPPDLRSRRVEGPLAEIRRRNQDCRETLAGALRDLGELATVSLELAWLTNVLLRMPNHDDTLRAAVEQRYPGKKVLDGLPPAAKPPFDGDAARKAVEGRLLQLQRLRFQRDVRLRAGLAELTKTLDGNQGLVERWMGVFPDPSVEYDALNGELDQLRQSQATCRDAQATIPRLQRFVPGKGKKGSENPGGEKAVVEAAQEFHTRYRGQVSFEREPERLLLLEPELQRAAKLEPLLAARVVGAARLRLRATVPPGGGPRPEEPIVAFFRQRAEQVEQFLASKGVRSVDLLGPNNGYGVSREAYLPK